MTFRKMRTSFGNYVAGVSFGMICAVAIGYFNGAEAVEKDIAAAIILWAIGIVLVIVFSIFTRPGLTKINGKAVDLCGVEINTVDLSDGSVKVSVAGLVERGNREASETMDAIKNLCGSVRGDANED